MKRIAVLLENAIHIDGRVIKLMRKMSEQHELHLFYHNGRSNDAELFNHNVVLHNVPAMQGMWAKVLRHSFFYRQHYNLLQAALRSGLQFDAVWCNDLTTLPAGLLLKKKQGSKLIYDSHEIYLETLNQFFPQQAGGLKQSAYNAALGLMRWLGKRAEARCLKYTDAFVTVNQSLVDYFKARYNYKRPIHIIMNCPLRWQAPAQPKVDYRKMYGWQADDFVFILQGSLNAGRGIERLMRIIPALPVHLKFVFLGRGPLFKVIERWIPDNQLEKRVVISQVAAIDMLDHCAAADCGINLLEPLNKSKEFTSATKLFEYMQAGIPAVCSNVIENRRIFEKYNIGLLIENDDDVLRNALMQMGTADLSEYKAECRRAAYYYCWENQVNVLAEIIQPQ